MSFQKEGTTRLAIWKIEDDWDGLCRAVNRPSLVDEALQRFGSMKRRMEWLAVRAALQQMEVGSQEIAYLPSGKPYLKSGEWQIGISHTQGYAAVILGKTPVSVDIEQYGQRVHRVRERFIRPDEEVRPYKEEDTWSLLLHWSAKEAVYKMIDDIDIDFLDQLQVLPFTPSSEGEFQVCERKSPRRWKYTVRYALHPEFVMTWIINPPVPTR